MEPKYMSLYLPRLSRRLLIRVKSLKKCIGRLGIFVYAFLVFCTVIILFWFRFWGQALCPLDLSLFSCLLLGTSGSIEHWGQFGDFVGGLINPIIGLFTIVLLLRSLHVSRKELALTRAATETASNAQIKMEQSMREQLEEAKSQNNFSNYYKHLEEFEKYISMKVIKPNGYKIEISERNLHRVMYVKPKRVLATVNSECDRRYLQCLYLYVVGFRRIERNTPNFFRKQIDLINICRYQLLMVFSNCISWEIEDPHSQKLCSAVLREHIDILQMFNTIFLFDTDLFDVKIEQTFRFLRDVIDTLPNVMLDSIDENLSESLSSNFTIAHGNLHTPERYLTVIMQERGYAIPQD